MITPAWRLLWIRGERVLLCLLCNRYSAHPTDIAEKFCGHCDVWLDDLPELYRTTKPVTETIVHPLFNRLPEEDVP